MFSSNTSSTVLSFEFISGISIFWVGEVILGGFMSIGDVLMAPGAEYFEWKFLWLFFK